MYCRAIEDSDVEATVTRSFWMAFKNDVFRQECDQHADGASKCLTGGGKYKMQLHKSHTQNVVVEQS